MVPGMIPVRGKGVRTMSDRKYIYIGIAVLLIVVLYPFLHGLVTSGDTTQPELYLPSDASECIEETEYMTANHMVLLNEWRDTAVREGIREYTSQSGEIIKISLTGTCISCHGRKDEFCARCHDYSNVTLTCWNCHVTPEGN